MLKSIKKYSPSELKYEKKISINFNKQSYFFNSLVSNVLKKN